MVRKTRETRGETDGQLKKRNLRGVWRKVRARKRTAGIRDEGKIAHKNVLGGQGRMPDCGHRKVR